MLTSLVHYTEILVVAVLANLFPIVTLSVGRTEAYNEDPLLFIGVPFFEALVLMILCFVGALNPWELDKTHRALALIGWYVVRVPVLWMLFDYTFIFWFLVSIYLAPVFLALVVGALRIQTKTQVNMACSPYIYLPLYILSYGVHYIALILALFGFEVFELFSFQFMGMVVFLSPSETLERAFCRIAWVDNEDANALFVLVWLISHDVYFAVRSTTLWPLLILYNLPVAVGLLWFAGINYRHWRRGIGRGEESKGDDASKPAS